ncbi:dipicolinate synthase subunit B [Natronospora cellulosivora (SeqCode)]
MLLEGLKIAFALTGSYCVFDQVIPQVENLVKEGAEVYPIISYEVAKTDSRFGKAKDFIAALEDICKKEVIKTMEGAEPIGVVHPVDLAILSPCTGNSLAKLADGSCDSPALMVMKGMLRNNKAVVIGIATNDGLGINAKNLGILLANKNVYFIPFAQDNYQKKPNSLVAKFDLTIATVRKALEGEQLQPILKNINNKHKG